MIERVPQEKWFEMPMGVQRVAWNVGHLATAEYFLGMIFVRGARESDAGIIRGDYAELFGYNSVPTSDPDRYPSPTELLETLDAVHGQLLGEVRAMPDEEWEAPCLFLEGEFDYHPIFDRKGGALEWIAYHEYIHIGTIGLLRREMGGEPIQYFEESRGGRQFV